ncbi:MAG: site-specific integrase [Chloroflexi bacterium]|nr:site-specific integrase [Chloroflexota bacterium]
MPTAPTSQPRPHGSTDLALPSQLVPPVIHQAGAQAARRYLEFFAAHIRNPNTRTAYARTARVFFAWCAYHGLALHQIEPIAVAAYIETVQRDHAAPTVKQHLAALRRLFDWLVIGQVLPSNPAASVNGPKHVTRTGKTPVLEGEQARALLAVIETDTVKGLRDRALIAVMIYTFGRVGAVTRLRGEDYYQNGKRWWLRLHEKGGSRCQLVAVYRVYVQCIELQQCLWQVKASAPHSTPSWVSKTTWRSSCQLPLTSALGSRCSRSTVDWFAHSWCESWWESANGGRRGPTCCFDHCQSVLLSA